MQHGYRESLVNVLYIHTSYDVSTGNLLYSVVNFKFSVMTTVLFFYNNVWSVNLDTCTFKHYVRKMYNNNRRVKYAQL